MIHTNPDHLLFTLDWLCQEWAEDIDQAPEWLQSLYGHWQQLRQGQHALELQLDQFLTTPERRHVLLYQLGAAQITLLFSHPDHVPLDQLPPLPPNRKAPVGLIYTQHIADTIDAISDYIDPDAA